MNRLLSFLLGFILLAHPATAQTSGNDASLWTYHLAYREAQQVVCANHVVFADFNGNLLAYDTSDNSVMEWNRRTGLNDKGIRYMAYSQTQKCLVVLYTSNNIDLICDNGDVVNISTLKNFSDYDISVSSLNVAGDWATLSTTEGVVLLDLKQQEVKAYYRFGASVRDAVVWDGRLLAALDHTVVAGSLTANLYTLDSWQQVEGFLVSKFVPFADGCYMVAPYLSQQVAPYGGLYYVTKGDDGQWNTQQVTATYLDMGNATRNSVQFAGSGAVLFTDAEHPTSLTSFSLGHYLSSVSRDADGRFWLVDTRELKYFNWNAQQGTAEQMETPFGNFGPLRDYAYKLHYEGTRLLVAGGLLTSSYVPTGMVYDDGKWSFFQTSGDNVVLNDNITLTDFNDIAQDPNDPTHHYVSFFGGVAEYKDYQFVRHYGSSNSALEYEGHSGLARPKYTIVNGMRFDADGNLWMLNSQTKNAIKVLKTDGEWAVIPVNGLNQYSLQVDKLLFDDKGRAWINSRRESSVSSGVVCLDYDGTIDDTSDDESMLRSTAVNEDGTTCDLRSANDICFDRNGQLWVAAEHGVFVVQNPDNWSSTDFSIYQPKVPRNDGTNYADYLLNDVPATCIAVDGGNRKWIGTLGSGIYLVNADGSEVISHFTAEDTPLLSDNIYSLAIHPTSGELMIGTDAGLCSYQTGVTQPEQSLSKSQVKVYPNPVRPDYHGRVTVAGLTEGAEVKIVSAGGQLVARGNSTGGSFLWDACNAAGQRVAPGVYYIMVSTADGGSSVASKVVVI